MVSLEALTDYLDSGNPFPCLSVLEAALACAQYIPEKSIPEPLLEDLKQCHGKDNISKEIDFLVKLGILVYQGEKENHSGLRLINIETEKIIADLLDWLLSSAEMQLKDKTITAGTFLEQGVSYLETEIPELRLKALKGSTKYILEWQDETYQFQLAFSPIWLPVAAGDYYLALFGPFAAQGWEIMHKYYAFPQFRGYIAYYDPWNQQKMNISKGRLLSFVDWFYRDVHGLKFNIPPSFAEGLHHLGLLRYNDER
ncbi:MAG: hypothetical protein ACOXZ5_06020 [Syntrophomonadaceae bacterium]|jgi:hypothetical protein